MKKIFFSYILLTISFFLTAQESKEIKVNNTLQWGKTLPLKQQMSTKEIMEMINNPFYSTTDKGKQYQVAFFYITYIERGLFYDENGKPFIGSDAFGVESDHGKIPEDWQSILKDRLKTGDTLRFTNLMVYPNPKEEHFFYAPDATVIIK